MTRAGILLSLLVVSACGGPSERELRQSLDAGRLAVLRGELSRAQDLADRGLALTGDGPQSPWPWEFRLLQAEVLLAKRDTAAAASSLAAPVPDSPPFKPLRARQQLLRARVKLAERSLQESLTIAEGADALADGAPGLQLDIGAFRGQVLFQLGRWDDAERQLTQVASQAARAKDRYHEAFALHQLGTGQLVRSRFDQALLLFERVLAFDDLAEMTVYSAALNNAGVCYSRLGLFERAASVQRRAVEAFQRRGSPTEYAQALGTLGNIYLLQGDARTGLSYLQTSFKVAKDAKVMATATVGAGNLATAFIELEQWDDAERFNEEAKELRKITGSGQPVYDTLSSASIAAGRGRFDEATALFTGVLASPNPSPSILWNAHAGLAGVATATHEFPRAARHFEAALNVIETTRSGLLKTDYKVSYLAQLISFYQAYVDTLVNQGQVERALEIADSSRGRILAERQGSVAPRRVSAAAVLRLARESRTVLLSYWLAPTKSYLWIVSPDGITFLTLPPAREIDALVEQHRRAIADVMADPLAARDSPGDELYRLLIAPAKKWLPPDASVVLVPDGSLHGINFETLPVDGPRRHYWIEDAEVQVAPSLGSLVVTRPPSRSERSLLLIGNPAPRLPEFPALSYAQTEMSNISKYFAADAVTAFDGDRASPAAYRGAQPQGFTFIHFTAHATANLESPLDSAVILSGPDGAYKLYAREVAAEPLGAELVIVSACRSAGERAYSGEGLVGFSWAFLRAGAHRVIAGLWDVDDRSTADLMGILYAELGAGESPARALRNAKLSLLRGGGGGARPYNWGPFELFTVTP